jgi:hypothetical protein
MDIRKALRKKDGKQSLGRLGTNQLAQGRALYALLAGIAQSSMYRATGPSSRTQP